jgi:hypothetical protein
MRKKKKQVEKQTRDGQTDRQGCSRQTGRQMETDRRAGRQ